TYCIMLITIKTSIPIKKARPRSFNVRIDFFLLNTNTRIIIKNIRVFVANYLLTAFRQNLFGAFFTVDWVKFTRRFKGSKKIYGALNVLTIWFHGLPVEFCAAHIPLCLCQ